MLKKFLRTSLFVVGICFIHSPNILANTDPLLGNNDRVNDDEPRGQTCCNPSVVGLALAGPSVVVDIDRLNKRHPKEPCSAYCVGCAECDACVQIQTCLTLPAIACGTVDTAHKLGLYVKNNPLDGRGLQPKRAPWAWWFLTSGTALTIAGLTQPSQMSGCTLTDDQFDQDPCANLARVALLAAGGSLAGMSVLFYSYKFIRDCCRK